MMKYLFALVVVALEVQDPGVNMVSGGEGACFNGKGKHYNGMEKKTASGRTCAFWKDLEDSHGVNNSANFCRNRDESQPAFRAS